MESHNETPCQRRRGQTRPRRLSLPAPPKLIIRFSLLQVPLNPSALPATTAAIGPLTGAVRQPLGPVLVCAWHQTGTPSVTYAGLLFEYAVCACVCLSLKFKKKKEEKKEK